ncbi:MAG: tyrosine-type recombinase/integrase [Candidatus Obscuribacterales bacterium]|jgi:integrase
MSAATALPANLDDDPKIPTLNRAWKKFMKYRAKHMKPATLASYATVLNAELADWMPKRLNEIKRRHVVDRHASITAPAQANLTMRILRTVYNFAIDHYRAPDDSAIITSNPVDALSSGRYWNKMQPRANHLKKHTLVAWWNAIDTLRDESVRDFARLVILTGLRKTEARLLVWANIDFSDKVLRIGETKNGEPLALPLSDFTYTLLVTRFERRPAGNPFVFWHDSEPGAAIGEWNPVLRKLSKEAGIDFTTHDLRRSFVNFANACNINETKIKQLVNHKSARDVTYTVYLQADPEMLREPVQAITDFVLQNAGRDKALAIERLRNPPERDESLLFPPARKRNWRGHYISTKEAKEQI